MTGQGGFNFRTACPLKGPQQYVVIGRFPNVGLLLKSEWKRTSFGPWLTGVKIPNSVGKTSDGGSSEAGSRTFGGGAPKAFCPFFEDEKNQRVSDITAEKINDLLTKIIDEGKWATAKQIKYEV